MPTDLDDIETRLRSTLTAVAEQTTIEVDADDRLPTVVALADAPRHRSTRRGWLAVAVAAAVLLLVGFTVAVRGGDQGVSTSAAPPAATAPPAALEPTYVTPGLTAGDGSPVQIPPGGPIHWIGPAGEFEIQWEAQPFATKDHPKATDRFDGQDGLTFVVDRAGDLEAQQASRARLVQERDDVAKQLEQDPQNSGLRDQEAALTNNIALLDAQTADLQKYEPIDGGRGDLTLSIRGTVGLDELRKIALGLRVRDARTTGSTPGLGPATSAATGTAPNVPSDLVPVSPLEPGASPRPPVVVEPDGSSSGFRLVPPPLPDGVIPHGSPFDPGLTSADRAPASPLTDDRLAVPVHQPPTLSLTRGTALVQLYDVGGVANGGGLSLYEIADSGFDGSQIDWGGLTEIQPVTTANGLNLIDFGEQACRLPKVGDPTEQPAQDCGRTVIVWNADAVAMVIAGPSTVDALAFAQGIKPA